MIIIIIFIIIITLPILHSAIQAAYHVQDSDYNTCLFQGICLFVFFACCRVGEITESKNRRPISLSQVTKLCNSAHNVEAIRISF